MTLEKFGGVLVKTIGICVLIAIGCWAEGLFLDKVIDFFKIPFKAIIIGAIVLVFAFIFFIVYQTEKKS